MSADTGTFSRGITPSPAFRWYFPVMAGSGTLHRRAQGVWTLRVELPKQGKRRSWQSRTVRGSERKAKQVLAEMVADVNSRFVAVPSEANVTFRYLFDMWIAGFSLTTDRQRAASTQYQERRRFEHHIAPRFGDVLVAKVEPIEIRRWYDELRRGRKDQSALSSTSVARIHETLRAMCAWGVQKEVIPVNPLASVKRPKVVVPAPRPPEPDALMILLNRLWNLDRKLWLAVRLAATIGARRSELAALTWPDVSFGAKGTFVTLDKGYVRVPHQGLVKTETKTGSSGTGRLQVDDELSEVLKGQFMVQLANNDSDPNSYVFASDPKGQVPWHPDTFSSKLRRANDYLDTVPENRRITFKSLRAFTASELANLGKDVTTAQAVLRHKSAQTTLRHYSAARERKVRESTAGVGDVLNRERFLHRFDPKPDAASSRVSSRERGSRAISIPPVIGVK